MQDMSVKNAIGIIVALLCGFVLASWLVVWPHKFGGDPMEGAWRAEILVDRYCEGDVLYLVLRNGKLQYRSSDASPCDLLPGSPYTLSYHVQNATYREDGAYVADIALSIQHPTINTFDVTVFPDGSLQISRYSFERMSKVQEFLIFTLPKIVEAIM